MSNMRRALLGALTVFILGIVAAPPASAIAPEFRSYVGCPNIPTVPTCVRADTRGGHIQIGTTDVPINQTVTLSGGLESDSPNFPDANLLYTAQGGLTGNPLEVPGGLVGLTGISEFIINLITFGANRVYAQAQLVGTPQLNVFNLGIRMPIKVNLINPFLRSGCAIGSTADPIRLNLTVGTTAPPPPNRPISGHPPVFTGGDPANENILLFRDVKHVDNSFRAPRAYNCDLLGFGLISGLIDSRVGLPSAAGRNEAVLDRTDVRLVDRELVYP